MILPMLLWGHVLCGCLTVCGAAEPPIDGTTAPRWSPCTGWTTTPPTAYSVTNENGSLVFSAQGANREMPWILSKLWFANDLPADTVCSGVMQARFDTSLGLRCTQLSVAGLEQALTCEAAPIFEVSVGDKPLPAQDWSLARTESVSAGKRFILRHTQTQLVATVECTPGADNELLLRMTLTNESDQPTTATLRFPLLRGLCVGGAADT